MKKITVRIDEETAKECARYCKSAFFTMQNLAQAFLELYRPSRYPEVSDRALALRQDRVASYSRDTTSTPRQSSGTTGAVLSAHTGGRNKTKKAKKA